LAAALDLWKISRTARLAVMPLPPKQPLEPMERLELLERYSSESDLELLNLELLNDPSQPLETPS
jgi:hypothetical protein